LEVLYEALDHALTSGSAEPGRSDGRTPVERVLAHEQRAWTRLAPPPETDEDLRAAAVALATLAGAEDHDQAHRLLACVPQLSDPDGAGLRENVIAWLAGLYDGPALLNPLRPDKLGETLIAGVLQTPEGTDLLTAVLMLPDDAQVTRTLDVLARTTTSHPATVVTAARAVSAVRGDLTDRARAQARPTPGRQASRLLGAGLTRLLLGPLASAVTNPQTVPDADHPDYRYHLGVDYRRLGDLAIDGGQVEQARELHTRAKGIDERLVAEDPDNPTYRFALSFDYIRLGDLAIDSGQVEQARELYTRMLGIDEQLVAEDPDNPAYRHALGMDYERLGDLVRGSGQVEQARELFTLKLGIDEQLVADDPDNPTYRYSLGNDYERLGKLAIDSGQVEQARELYTRMLGIDELLVAEDPDNPTYRYALGIDYERLGKLALDCGQVEQARELYTRMFVIDEQLVAEDPDNPTYRYALGIDCERLGELALADGQVEQARELYSRMLNINEQLVALDLDNPSYREALGSAEQGIRSLDA
jgi:tetratricopeptide (TPR) repeat protein